jgi:hypothetical protein
LQFPFSQQKKFQLKARRGERGELFPSPTLPHFRAVARFPPQSPGEMKALEMSPLSFNMTRVTGADATRFNPHRRHFSKGIDEIRNQCGLRGESCVKVEGGSFTGRLTQLPEENNAISILHSTSNSEASSKQNEAKNFKLISISWRRLLFTEAISISLFRN